MSAANDDHVQGGTGRNQSGSQFSNRGSQQLNQDRGQSSAGNFNFGVGGQFENNQANADGSGNGSLDSRSERTRQSARARAQQARERARGRSEDDTFGSTDRAGQGFRDDLDELRASRLGRGRDDGLNRMSDDSELADDGVNTRGRRFSNRARTGRMVGPGALAGEPGNVPLTPPRDDFGELDERNPTNSGFRGNQQFSSSATRNFVDNLRTPEEQRFTRFQDIRNGDLGLTFERGRGLTIADIAPNSPLSDLDLQPGDQILSIGDRRITSERNLIRELFRQGPLDEPVSISVMRNGEEHMIELTPTDLLNQLSQGARPSDLLTNRRLGRTQAFGTGSRTANRSRTDDQISDDISNDSDQGGVVGGGFSADNLDELRQDRLHELEEARERARDFRDQPFE